MPNPPYPLRSARALLIFEAAARRGSCSAAAREFNLTQPSISRNIAELERALETKLFLRRPSGLELTADGQLLFRTMSDAVRRIEETLGEIGRRKAKKQVVELSLSTAFVTHWFVPRMHEFNAAFPDVDVRFQLTSGALKGPLGNVDLGMRRTDAEERDERTWVFAPELVLPVASPTYVERHGRLGETWSEAAHVLIELSGTEIDWRALLAVHGEQVSQPTPSLEFSDYAVALQTAIGGQGIALGWVSAVSRMLLDRTLVPASEHRLATGRNFSLIAPRGRPVRDVVLKVRDWMISEMRRDLERLEPLLATRSGTWAMRAAASSRERIMCSTKAAARRPTRS